MVNCTKQEMVSHILVKWLHCLKEAQNCEMQEYGYVNSGNPNVTKTLM
jgi:hypothetical protein